MMFCLRLNLFETDWFAYLCMYQQNWIITHNIIDEYESNIMDWTGSITF